MPEANQGIVPAGTLPYRSFKKSEAIKISVDVSSKGNQAKWKTIDGKFYIKELFYYDYQTWKDNMVEVIASQYAALCKLPAGMSVVRQGLCDIDGRSASYSEAFDFDGSYYVSYHRLRESWLHKWDDPRGTHEEIAQQIISDCSDFAGHDVSDYLHTMFFLDCIVSNEDRHLNNFGFVCRPDASLEFSPLFDFGLGLFECGDEYCKHKARMSIPKVRLKPCWFTQKQLVSYLLDNSNIANIAPDVVRLSDFKFPNKLARHYFVWVNERLGVKVAKD